MLVPHDGTWILEENFLIESTETGEIWQDTKEKAACDVSLAIRTT